jgi:predicted aspartyl protease
VRLNRAQGETQAAVVKLDREVSSWRPQVEAAVQELREEVGDLRQQLDLVGKMKQASPATSSPRVPLTDEERKAPLLPTPPTSSQAAAAEGGNKLASGRLQAHEHRGRVLGMNATLGPTPVKGAYESPSTSLKNFDQFELGGGEFDGDQFGRQYNHRVPKLDFPKFDGTDPEDWKMRCEHYFDVNNTFPGLWVRIATIYFLDRAASWLRSSKAHVRFPVWENFCIAVSHKFDRDQHETLIRQMDSIKQTGTVWEYYERFDELMNQLLTYDPVLNMRYLTHRFTEGLRQEIRNAVLLQRPKDLENALAVAMLQEEVISETMTVSVPNLKKSDGGNLQIRPNVAFKGALPLPLPPNLGSGSGVLNRSEDRKFLDNTKTGTSNDKISTLKAQRRAQGLCYICAEKWSPIHKCANTIQLHAVQELLTVLQSDLLSDQGISDESDGLDSPGLMSISVQAINGFETVGCMRMLGYVQGKEVLILVDSGSTASFISSKIAQTLQGVVTLEPPVQVKVANGSILTCLTSVPRCEWMTQGWVFYTDLKVLNLGSYDMILGMDWLMAHSPMQVDWVNKLLTVSWRKESITLQGILSETEQCSQLSSQQFLELKDRQAISHLIQLCTLSESSNKEQIPVEIQQVLAEFGQVFEEPSGLPPSRVFDHTIPPMPGATPVNVRPYRYTPAQKDVDR